MPLPMCRWLVIGAHRQRDGMQAGALSQHLLHAAAGGRIDFVILGSLTKYTLVNFSTCLLVRQWGIFSQMSAAKIISRKRPATVLDLDDDVSASNQRLNLVVGNRDVIEAAASSVPITGQALERTDADGNIQFEAVVVATGSGPSVAISAVSPQRASARPETPMSPQADVVATGTGPSDAISAVSPQRAAAKPETPLSPTNRDRILASCAPVKVNCSLSAPGLSNPNTRFDFQAVVLIAYPMCEKPDRRHVSLIDRFGVTGITVWSNHVAMFSPQSVGLVVKFSNLSVVTHNNKRGLSMNRDSSIRFLTDVELRRSDEHQFWSSRLTADTLTIFHARSLDDDSVVSISGILFSIQIEVKRVRNDDKELLTLRLADATGHIDVRSWHSSDADFRGFIDKPIQLQRIRVTSFAGNKVAELLDGDHGTVVSGVFAGATALSKFWSAPSV